MTTASKHGQPAHREFWAGARQTIPLIVGATPFGIIFGTLAQSSGLSFSGAMGMSAIVFAGSSQFIALGLLGAGTPLGIIILTTWVVNLRHLLYAVSLVPYVKHLSQAWKLPLGFWLTDENFMVAIQRYRQPDPSPHKHWFQLGSALAMYVNWQLCTLLGLTLGQTIPNASAWGLDFAMVATFIGMTIPYLTNRPMVATVVTAGITALLARGLPHQLGLMVAAIAAILTGVLLENYLKKTHDS
ncbi:branched-chain amino acid transport protein [Leptolyngbya sp. Heron Island J]|uniref:AzlC family ABC transporter permease n=1 Tax=Leptolyngbya sp. Heron Island J TaxID=1385935 RepID=UPI0003B9F317|nr:AzlC family ABC transporter permease [Leptolyngbya sp. Heron Island J]ESA34517.1 branched-chain amino acid transport protein [Leptolyngbya sp. Heron Island J]